MIDIKQNKLYKPLDFDSFLGGIFNIYFKKFLILTISSFMASFVIQMTMYQLGFTELYTISDPEELMKAFSFLVGRIGILIGVSVLVYGLLNAFLINYILRSDEDTKVNIGQIASESFGKHGIHMIFFLLLSTIIFIAGAFFGIMVFVVGIFFAMLYLATVIIPGMTIVVAEEKNAVEAVGRTFSLVHKDFWWSVGLVVIFILILLLIVIVLGEVQNIIYNLFNGSDTVLEVFKFHKYEVNIWSVVMNSILSAITYPLYAILSVVLYIKLRYTEDQKMMN